MNRPPDIERAFSALSGATVPPPPLQDVDRVRVARRRGQVALSVGIVSVIVGGVGATGFVAGRETAPPRLVAAPGAVRIAPPPTAEPTPVAITSPTPDPTTPAPEPTPTTAAPDPVVVDDLALALLEIPDGYVEIEAYGEPMVELAQCVDDAESLPMVAEKIVRAAQEDVEEGQSFQQAVGRFATAEDAAAYLAAIPAQEDGTSCTAVAGEGETEERHAWSWGEWSPDVPPAGADTWLLVRRSDYAWGQSATVHYLVVRYGPVLSVVTLPVAEGGEQPVESQFADAVWRQMLAQLCLAAGDTCAMGPDYPPAEPPVAPDATATDPADAAEPAGDGTTETAPAVP